MEELNLHQALCEIRKRRIEPDHGICSNLVEQLLNLGLKWIAVRRVNELFRVLCTEWPDYGAARWRLLDWAIAELEARIGQK